MNLEDLALELEPETTGELALELEPELTPDAAAAAVVEAFASILPPVVTEQPAALMQILPSDFPLPILTRFVPDAALRAKADDAAKYALSLEIKGEEGVTRGDAACAALRSSLKGLEAHFEEPADIANRLHKQITGTRSEWCAPAKGALDIVGRRVATEQRRLQQEAAEIRRRAQEEEDRKERERRRLEAEAAARANVPAPVVQEMQRAAETATAPPVQEERPAAKLSGSSVVATWKARVAGTPASYPPNPAMADLSQPQRAKVLELLSAILNGQASLTLLELNWSAINARAKAERSAFSIPGFESFEDVSIRAKATRTK